MAFAEVSLLLSQNETIDILKEVSPEFVNVYKQYFQ